MTKFRRLALELWRLFSEGIISTIKINSSFVCLIKHKCEVLEGAFLLKWKSMKKLFHICLFITLCSFLSGCLSHIYEVILPDSSMAITIPADGGTYSFEVEAGPETKTSFADRLWSFEYRISIDGNIIEQQIVNIDTYMEHIHEGDTFTVDFTIPANQSAEHRDIMVEALKARNENYYAYHVDADDKDWKLVWQGTQLGR